MTKSTALVQWDQLRQDVEQARSIDDLKELRDKSEALRQYSKRQKESIELQNKFAEITLRCRRRMGEMLQETLPHEGGRPMEKRSHHATVFPPRLEDIGITKSDSSRCQAIARLPEEAFEQYILYTSAKHEEITTAGCIKQARRYEQQEQEQEVIEIVLDHSDYPVYSLPVARLGEMVPANSVDIILTDPPYPREFLPVYAELADFALHALKDGGSLIAMVGQSYLPDILDMLRKGGLTYHWLCCYEITGYTSKQWQRNIGIAWKPLVWFVKGTYTGPWRKDVIRGEEVETYDETYDRNNYTIGQKKDKQYHEWGQPESDMATIIDRYTEEGDLICDPFVGGGSTAVASIACNRRFVGGDIEEKWVYKTRQRIKDALTLSNDEDVA